MSSFLFFMKYSVRKTNKSFVGVSSRTQSIYYQCPGGSSEKSALKIGKRGGVVYMIVRSLLESLTSTRPRYARRFVLSFIKDFDSVLFCSFVCFSPFIIVMPCYIDTWWIKM